MNTDRLESLSELTAKYCFENLDLDSAELGSEYSYPNLPLCIIDTVFSIGVSYASTRNTVDRFCRFLGAESTSTSFSVSSLLSLYHTYSPQRMAAEVFGNKQRTSTVNGILKAEAVMLFSKAVRAQDVEYLKDSSSLLNNKEFEESVLSIPGQRSGISLRYFYMLIGSDDFVKPDRMILRFLQTATDCENITPDLACRIVQSACEFLRHSFPNMTPRLLDNIIWRFKSEEAKENAGTNKRRNHEENCRNRRIRPDEVC
jgi:hypothetical protein